MDALHKLGRDRRGVAYVEQIVVICIGLLIATLIVAAGSSVFAVRFQSVLDGVYSSAP